jgi:hypothetical protein
MGHGWSPGVNSILRRLSGAQVSNISRVVQMGKRSRVKMELLVEWLQRRSRASNGDV